MQDSIFHCWWKLSSRWRISDCLQTKLSPQNTFIEFQRLPAIDVKFQIGVKLCHFSCLLWLIDMLRFADDPTLPESHSTVARVWTRRRRFCRESSLAGLV